MKEVDWLVTVHGYDLFFGDPYITVSITIKLPENKTPIQWFLEKPTISVIDRFNFRPKALLNFWKIE